MKIEPMSQGEIRSHVEDHSRLHADKSSVCAFCGTCRLILAWIHTEARARKAQAWLTWLMNNKEGPSPSLAEDWIAAVKKEVGWVED